MSSTLPIPNSQFPIPNSQFPIPNSQFPIPNGFLSLGVERLKAGKLRPSYVVWEENYIVPILVLEVVSKTYGGEYDEKMTDYAKLGVLYSVIYNPDYCCRDKHDSFEVYRLVEGVYQRQLGEPVWMPEIGLGIGPEIGTYDRCQREWLYWYDSEGTRFLMPDEAAEQERQRTQRLAERLRELGIDPEQV